MKKVLMAIFGAAVLILSSCSKHHDNTITPSYKGSSDYAKIIAIPDIVRDLLDDKQSPVIGDQNAKKAVVVFFDYNCGKCAQISEQVETLIKNNPDVKFIFKAYPSTKRDSKVANYATLVAYEAYSQGGSELFQTYNKAIFSQRETNGKLTDENINGIAEHLGIKIDKQKLKEQAKNEELETRKLGKLIGFHGPHSFVVLPTNLGSMNSEQLSEHVNEIYVISGKETNEATSDNAEAAKWVANKIQAKLNEV